MSMNNTKQHKYEHEQHQTTETWTGINLTNININMNNTKQQKHKHEKHQKTET